MISVYASCYSDNTAPEAPIFISVSGRNAGLRSDDYYDVGTDGYIGVTPNKEYTVTVSADSPDRVYIDRFYIEYSPEINKQTPTITDY